MNGVYTYQDIQNGNNSMAAFDGSKTLTYALGVGLLLVPGLEEFGAGILTRTMIVDMAGDVVINRTHSAH